MSERSRPYADLADRLTAAGLRPTRQRLAIGRLLLDGPPRHVTAEQVFSEVRANDTRVSLATVYNTLNQFTAAGLLHEVVIDSGRSYFDTNIGEHIHVYNETTGTLQDVDIGNVHIDNLPPAPTGTSVVRVDVIVRVKDEAKRSPDA